MNESRMFFSFATQVTRVWGLWDKMRLIPHMALLFKETHEESLGSRPSEIAEA